MPITTRGDATLLSINFALQSSLHQVPEYRRRQLWCVGAYAGLCLSMMVLSLALPTERISGAALGLAIPGGGFLHWASGGQVGLAFMLFAAAFCIFIISLVLWLATGNIIAPLLTWGAAAWMSTQPEMLGLSGTLVAGSWTVGVGPAISALVIGAWLCPVRTRVAAQTQHGSMPVYASQDGEEKGEISLENLKRIQLLLDRALQPSDRFDGFEWRDQFQTAAIRYQVNFVSYALALAKRHYAPAAHAPFSQAQELLLQKLGDRRLWNYWQIENAWGNLKFSADPVIQHNIMYSGFATLQMALSDTDSLILHDQGEEWARYRLDSIAELLARQYRTSSYGLLSCEPNWIYPLCNLITATGIKAADARLGSERWASMSGAFFASLDREATSADGNFLAMRSSVTGVGIRGVGGIVMQAFPCLFLNALSPERAQAHWYQVRHRLDTESWKRLFWPVDVGNYGFSRASSYAATAAAAVEMGDREVAAECLRRLEHECPSYETEGAVHRGRASLWAHALEIMARSGRHNGLRDAVANAPIPGGLHLSRVSCAKALVARAQSDGTGIDLVLQPGGGARTPAIEINGLQPGAYYRTQLPRWPLLKADHEGRGVLRVPLSDRTALSIQPF